MSEDIRIDVSLRVTRATADAIDRLAKERNSARTNLVLQALGVLQAMHDGAKDGYVAGLTRDRSKLDTVLVSPF